MENKTKTRNRKDNYTEIPIEKKPERLLRTRCLEEITPRVLFTEGEGGTCPGY